jgi:hypothetical protein
MNFSPNRCRPAIHAVAWRLAAACCEVRQHRAIVLAVNVGLVACAAVDPLTLSFALHVLLLPVNAWRLLSAVRQEGSILRATA